MHVSGGDGREYRAHFRRDFPTGQAFPNLWPFKVKLDSWNLGNFPSGEFDNMVGTLSEEGVVSSDQQEMRYTWNRTFLGETSTFDLICRHGDRDTKQSWRFLFTNNVTAGLYLIAYDLYLLDTESDLWQITRALEAGHYAITAVGGFGGVLFDGPTPEMLFFAAEWSELPPDEQHP